MFIAKDGDLIVLARETFEELARDLKFIVHTSIEEVDEELTLYNGRYLTVEEVQKEEQSRINMLTMTALDFINVLKSTGLTAQQIEDYLNANIDLKQQLTYCQNVYCGVVRQILPISVGGINITDDMVVAAFRAKNGEIV